MYMTAPHRLLPNTNARAPLLATNAASDESSTLEAFPLRVTLPTARRVIPPREPPGHHLLRPPRSSAMSEKNEDATVWSVDTDVQAAFQTTECPVQFSAVMVGQEVSAIPGVERLDHISPRRLCWRSPPFLKTPLEPPQSGRQEVR
jgi:hypothetical protein